MTPEVRTRDAKKYRKVQNDTWKCMQVCENADLSLSIRSTQLSPRGLGYVMDRRKKPAVVPFLSEVAKDVKYRKPHRRYDPAAEKPFEDSSILESLPTTLSHVEDSVDSSDEDDSSFGDDDTVSSSEEEESRDEEILDDESEDDSEYEAFRVKSWRQQFEDFKRRQREKRRHPLLKYMEMEMEREHERAMAEDQRQAEIAAEEEDHREERRQREQAAKEFRDRVAKEDAHRYRRLVKRREKQRIATQHLMRNLDNAAARKTLEQKLPTTTTRKDQAPKSDDDPDDVPTAILTEEEHLSQEVLAIMRRAGVLPGVNAPPTDDVPEQRETDLDVVLRVNKTTVPREKTPEKTRRKKKKRKRPSILAIDLGRYRNVERLKGEAIGPMGALDLAAHLAKGACPHLTTLDLGWNRIQFQGLFALAAAFDAKAVPNLTSLDLRANSLGSDSVDVLIDALTHHRLRNLDLRHNLLKDTGACRLASRFLAGDLRPIETLILHHNDIGNQGTFAIFKALTARAFPSLCPGIVHVSLRYNKATADVAQSVGLKCPAFLSM